MMDIMEIHFEADEGKFKRVIMFPDGSRDEQAGVELATKWYDPQNYSFIRPFHEYTLDELQTEGERIGRTLLGNCGIEYLRSCIEDGRVCKVVILESVDLPQVAAVPWELAWLDDRFITTDALTPVVRRSKGVRPKNRIKVGRPLRMAILSASPSGAGALKVEEELLSLALALSEPMAKDLIVVDEVINCTQEKLKEALRTNTYDIVYFTGHGCFENGTGYLALESVTGEVEYFSAGDLVSVLRKQKELALVFLNCCNAGAVGKVRAEGWKGFGDVARRVLKLGVPEVIATQAAIFDDTGRMVMKTFFEELCRKEAFDVAEALSIARSDVESDLARLHDFYHFVHFSALSGQALVENFIRDEAEKIHGEQWRNKVVCQTDNYMVLDQNFVGRYSFISKIEEAWWSDSVRVVGLHGIGGIGKTFLCNRMEQRGLCHYIEAKRFDRSIWLDFREGKGDTLSGFFQQLFAVARDLGFSEFQKVVDDNENFPAPPDKFKLFSKHLASCGRVLLILDNLETVVDTNGNFHDELMGQWFRQLVVRTPVSTRVLVTSRHRFPFFPDGRELVESRWVHLTQMGFTERICLVDRRSELRSLPDQEKIELIRVAGGHPFHLKLVINYMRSHKMLPDALKEASRKTAEYARLDFFLSLLTPRELDWLFIAAVFPSPRNSNMLIIVKAMQDQIENLETIKIDFQRSIARLMDLSLLDMDTNGVLEVHPLVIFQLTGNHDSHFRCAPEEMEALSRVIGELFYQFAETLENNRPKQVQVLLHGLEPVLFQPDIDLINKYLQSCASVFHGFVPASVFDDVVRRVENKLLEKADQDCFYTLSFCAQTLRQMRHFERALEVFDRILLSRNLSEELRGLIHGSQGTVYLMKRQWDDALENYQKALEWKEKTSNHFALGSTYHQIGMVYEEQRQWDDALENYQKALEWKEKTSNHFALGSTYHQIGRVYEEQRQWDDALENYQKALEWKEKTSNHFALGSTYHQIGMVYEEKGDFSKMAAAYLLSLELFVKYENMDAIGTVMESIQRVFPNLTEKDKERIREIIPKET